MSRRLLLSIAFTAGAALAHATFWWGCPQVQRARGRFQSWVSHGSDPCDCDVACCTCFHCD